MLKHIHQLIIEPGSDVRLLCKDGLSAATVYNIDRIYHFGGNFKFVDCGAGAIWTGLDQAWGSMMDKYMDSKDKFDGRGASMNRNCELLKSEDSPDGRVKFASTIDYCKAVL